MSTCPNCGTQVPDGGQFCPDCGAPTASLGSLTPPPSPTEPPVPPAPPAPATPAPSPQTAAPTPPPYSTPAPGPGYPQQYAPAAGVAQPPKKRRTGLIITVVAIILIALLGCCAGGAYLLFKGDGGSVTGLVNEDQAKVETLETFAIGLGTLDFTKIRSVTTADVQDEITTLEGALATEGESFGASTLLSSEWDEDTLLMSFEDPDGSISHIRIYPPTDGGTTLHTMDWDDGSTEADAVRTDFELIDEDGWKVYSIDGETLDVYLGF